LTVSIRKQSALVGALFLVTHVTSVGAVLLYGPMLVDDAWLAQSDAGTRQLTGAFLDVILALAAIGTGLALLPLLRAHARTGSLSYAVLRTAEGATILAGSAAVVALIWLRQDGLAATDGGHALLELYRAAFLLGPGFVIVANTLVLAVTLYRHRLVARWIPVLGMVGAPLVGVSNMAVMFGLQEQVSPSASLAAVPIFAWEISFAVYMLVRGMRTPAPAAT
jgi:hypothetical protein